jgi:hypothetical protein
MQWNEIRAHYPSQWLLIEAIQAHSEATQRVLDDPKVLEPFPDSIAAVRKYTERHQQAPERELYVVHSSRDKLMISERAWLGIRAAL